MTYTVGLTGGIGSGKSTVASLFSDLGAPIIDADVIARELVKSGKPAYQSIVHRFGRDILQTGAEINRSKLREIILQDPTERKWLETLLHPQIYQAIVAEISKVNYLYCIVVVPLLAENYALYKPILNHIVVLDVTEAEQIAWTTKREQCDPAMVKKLMAVQATRTERIKIADTLLENPGDLVTLEKKVKDLHKAFVSRNQLV